MKRMNTARLRWPFVVGIYMTGLCYFLFQGGKTAVMLFVMLNALLCYWLLGRWSGIGRVTGQRGIVGSNLSIDEQMLAYGSRLTFQLDMKIPSIYPLPYIIVRDRLCRHDDQESSYEVAFVPNWRRSGSIVYETPPLQRGEYRFLPTECLSYDVFGLFEHKGKFQADAKFSVMPELISLKQWSGMQRGIKGLYAYATSARSNKESTQIHGVREYMHGDRLSRIHWNATAKSGQWKSKAFERESFPRTTIILDGNKDSYGDLSWGRFELAVSVAASLAEDTLHLDNDIGLLTLAEKPMMLQPQTGPEQRYLIMKHLSVIDANATGSMIKALQSMETMLDPGGFAIVVSAQTGTELVQIMEWLARRGLVPCLLHIGPKGQSASPNASDAWIAGIREKGWFCYEIRQLEELPALLEGGGSA